MPRLLKIYVFIKRKLKNILSVYYIKRDASVTGCSLLLREYNFSDIIWGIGIKQIDILFQPSLLLLFLLIGIQSMQA